MTTDRAATILAALAVAGTFALWLAYILAAIT